MSVRSRTLTFLWNNIIICSVVFPKNLTFMEISSVMQYIIIIVAVVIFLLGFILRDDNDANDKGYNRDEHVDWKRSKRSSAYDKSSRPEAVPPSHSKTKSPSPQPVKPYTPKPTPLAGLSGNAGPQSKTVEKDNEPDWAFLDRLTYDEDLSKETMDSEISGLRYYCRVEDMGIIRGIVAPEPSNIHDPRAKAVIRSDGKLIGYLPRNDVNQYELMNEDHLSMVCPFAGRITINSKGWLESEIRIALPASEEFVEEELENYLRLLIARAK